MVDCLRAVFEPGAARPVCLLMVGAARERRDAVWLWMFCTGVVFDGVAEALRVPNTDIRLFGKPESFVKRRMGVALAFDADVQVARKRAKEAAARVTPRVP